MATLQAAPAQPNGAPGDHSRENGSAVNGTGGSAAHDELAELAEGAGDDPPQ